MQQYESGHRTESQATLLVKSELDLSFLSGSRIQMVKPNFSGWWKR